MGFCSKVYWVFQICWFVDLVGYVGVVLMVQDIEWIFVLYDICDQVVGLFYYGICVDFVVGELLSVGFCFNYCDSVVMNYIYFIIIVKGVGLVVEMV